MPYKDPERKRQWERDHSEQRNARRRKTAPLLQMPDNIPSCALDPISQPELANAGIFMAVGFAIILVVAICWLVRQSRVPDLPSDSRKR